MSINMPICVPCEFLYCIILLGRLLCIIVRHMNRPKQHSVGLYDSEPKMLRSLSATKPTGAIPKPADKVKLQAPNPQLWRAYAVVCRTLEAVKSLLQRGGSTLMPQRRHGCRIWGRLERGIS